MKNKDSATSSKAFKTILSHIGIPKTMYSDLGSESKNAEFQAVLFKHNIRIIFTLSPTPFIEEFNKTFQYKLVKYMELNGTKNWLEILEPVLETYNNTPQSTTK
jgi:transposase InsO family protein